MNGNDKKNIEFPRKSGPKSASKFFYTHLYKSIMQIYLAGKVDVKCILS